MSDSKKRVLNIRLPEHLHRWLKDAADEDERSVNSLVVKILKEKVRPKPATKRSQQKNEYWVRGYGPGEEFEEVEEENDEQS
jgi:hypothetical protein